MTIKADKIICDVDGKEADIFDVESYDIKGLGELHACSKCLAEIKKAIETGDPSHIPDGQISKLLKGAQNVPAHKR